MQTLVGRPWVLQASVFLAAFFVIHARSGPWPALWLDTLNDQREARRCVLEGSCSLLGQPASIDGVYVAGGWLHLQSLLLAIGLGLDGAYILQQVLDALGVGLVALAGARLGSRMLGAGAAFVLVWGLGSVGPTREAIYNGSPLVFYGAVLLVASLEAVSRPGVRPALVTGLLAAVMTDTHTVCAPTGITVVWVTLLVPERRLSRALACAAAFGTFAFVMAPLQWIENMRFALHRPGAETGVHVPLGAALRVMWSDPIARYSLLATVAWLVFLATRRRAARELLDVPIALVVPMLAAFLFGLGHGVDDSGGKYLAYVKPAAALGLLVPGLVLAEWLSARWPKVGRALPAVEHFLPWAAVLGILGTSREVARDPLSFPFLTMGDIDAYAHALGRTRGWSAERVRRHVQAIDPQTVQTALLEGDAASFRLSGPDDDGSNALLLEVESSEVPSPLPAGWEVVRRGPNRAALLIVAKSRLDWRHFKLCPDGEGARCVEEPDLRPDGRPPPLPAQGRLTLHVPLLPSGPEAPATSLFMPRLRDVCGGRIAAISGTASHIEPDRRHGVLAGEASAGGEVVLEWDVGSPQCPANYARPRAPFFLEADGPTSVAIEAMLARRER